MQQVLSRARLRALRLGGSLAVLALSFGGCDNGSSLVSNEGSVPPVDTTPTDTVTPPPPDTTPPPPPVDTTTPPGPVITPVHVGIPFGPFAVPPDVYGPQYTGAHHPRLSPDTLLADLEAARRTNTRIFINLTGNESYLRDANGFSMAKWKARVDAFRNIDLTSYIADGTIVGHYILDEPTDPKNWNGHIVEPAEIDELARYSKEIWPTMLTIVRSWPDHLIGYSYKYLDATFAQYSPYAGSSRYRLPIAAFIAQMVRDSRAAGVALVGGMNVLDAGSGSSGIPGRRPGKFAMSASEIREWGEAYLAEPYICGFLLWKYESSYFSRPDIKAAVAELKQKAENHPQKECRP